MPNYEIPVMPSSPVAMIACAIYCCDGKVYRIKRRPRLSPCTSLGKKKDHCVRQNVKKAMDKHGVGKDKIQIEPRKKVRFGGETIVCKPDFMVNGTHVIDAKFSCDEEKLKAKLPTTKRTAVQDYSVGPAKMTPKERDLYPRIKGKDGEKVKGVRVMGPEEAESKKGSDCKCS
jgi:hypothetical protein